MFTPYQIRSRKLSSDKLRYNVIVERTVRWRKQRLQYTRKSTRSPFRAAFNTPRPDGIPTNGVGEVPPTVSEYPEDLYDILQVGFGQAMI
jgi:hypothetical protein